MGLVGSYKKSSAQSGNVYTLAGGGISLADGVPATSAQIVRSTGIGTDATGNIYITDSSQCKIRKINPASGLIQTVAGTGTCGFSGDGGPSIAAQISKPSGIFVDGPGNIFIADRVNGRIRKVDAGTGIITTVAGGGSSIGDGIPATVHVLNPNSVYVDPSGNMYVGADYKLFKIHGITGIITTIAGDGIPADVGDGGPATAASFGSTIKSISMDATGNIYVISSLFGDGVRKIDAASGIITTVAGGGSSTSEGIPATNASFFNLRSCASDAAGNLFLADWNGHKIRRVDAVTGLINTIAGSSASSYVEGAPALTNFVNPYFIHLDAASGNIYYGNCGSTFHRFSFAPMYGSGGATFSDSFNTTVTHLCNGAQLTIVTPHYMSGRSLKTDFGDGSFDSSVILPGFISGGYTIANHTYSASGNYTIHQQLYSGSVLQDTNSFIYNYDFCRTFPVKFFTDGNHNCTKDASEAFYTHPSLVAVDSNGITVDTLSVTSGFSYNVYGSNPGDIYKFRVISTPAGVAATCPPSGYISDTISTGAVYPDKYFGLSCPTPTVFDLSVNAVVPVTGMHDQWGNIYVANSGCMPASGTVTLHFSPKYVYNLSTIHPAPAAASGNTITWNFTNISADAPAPLDFYYAIWNNPATGYLTAGDTVQSQVIVTPITGDANPSNNAIIFVDTVRASCDPNFIEVTPGCITSGALPTQLQYTIHFENTGTDTAHNIYVLDTLPSFANVNSLRIVMASAVMNIAIQQHDGYKIARFDFPSINLLDSSHHGECDGAFIYTVNTYAGLPDGVDILNRAGIYFDYNSVVMTNEAHNTIGGCWPTGVPEVKKNIGATLYPNPVTDILHIDMEHTAQYTIANVVGNTIQNGNFTKGTNNLQLSTLSAGIYFITLTNQDGTRSVHKVIKL